MKVLLIFILFLSQNIRIIKVRNVQRNNKTISINTKFSENEFHSENSCKMYFTGICFSSQCIKNRTKQMLHIIFIEKLLAIFKIKKKHCRVTKTKKKLY